MAEFPTGTVTFLFTDIEGSTRLLQALGPRFPEVLEDHAAIIRRAAADHDGIEVSTEGDSFFLVFRVPGDALAAAVAAQRALDDHDWPENGRVRVRMGLLSGEGALGGDNYVGLDVNRAARIAAAANGGQILLSESTRSLCYQTLPATIILRDLGEHRLKDLASPEHLYQVVADGLPSDFPPPRTLDARPNNLPAQLTSFIGREEVIAEVERLLEGTRLLTLSGPGGTGKTRLSLEVGIRVMPEFRDGVFFVELASITEPDLIPPTIANTLRVPEEAGRPVLETLKGHLKERDLLLILDNFEQVVEGAPAVEELLEAAPDLKAMVTSRTVLRVRGEQEYSVPPLVLPDPAHLPDLAALSQYEAVKLFIDRAMAVKPDFGIDRRNAPAVAEICARLDGLPLAIELAASRAKLLSPQDMLPRLERRLSLLTSGARGLPERQRTLRGAIAWSHDLLDEAERRLFARISTFMGGCTIEATEAVCDPGDLGVDVFEGLASLVDKSLLRQTGTRGGGSRFVMLETIREFAVEQLEAQGDAAAVRRRHGEHFLALAREAEPHLETDEQKPWLDRCDLEHGNIRSALRWALDAGEVEAGQESAGALWRFWQQRGHLAEARRWFDELLAAPGGQDRTPARGKALTGAGGIAYWQNDYPAAWAHYGEAVELYRDLGDRPRLANALYNMGFQPAVDHRYEEAAPYFEEAVHIAREEGLTETQAAAQSMLGYIEMWRRNYDAALPLVEETVEIHRRTGNRFKVADDLTGLALLYHLTGRTDEARQALRESLGMFRDVENPTGMGLALHGFASLAAAEGRHEDAALLSGASAKLKEMVGGGAPPELTSNYGDPVSEAKEHLDEETFQRAWQEGYSMPVDKAVAHALE